MSLAVGTGAGRISTHQKQGRISTHLNLCGPAEKERLGTDGNTKQGADG